MKHYPWGDAAYNQGNFMMDVSVVIVNWNTEQLLNDCLQTIYDNTKLVEFEVIVVDNASSDGSVRMVKDRFPRAILIENSENLGYATANNKGIAVARGRYILVLNSDMIFVEDAISQACFFADEHPDAAVVGVRMLNRDRSLQRNTFMFPSLLNLFLAASYLQQLFPGSRFFGRERMTWWDWGGVREVDVITGCFMLARREAVDNVGLMDTDFFMYFEETDWCYRFKKAGWKNIFTPAAAVIHLGGESTKKNAGPMLLQHYSSMLLYFLKHRGRVSYTLACALLILFFLVRIPYWLLHAVVSRKTRLSDIGTARIFASGVLKTVQGWRGLRIKF
jgi:GT2 family glycosyltransferase